LKTGSDEADVNARVLSARYTHPEALEVGREVDGVGCRQRDTLNDAAEVTQVEEIVRLVGRRQKTLDRLLVQRQSRLHDRVNAQFEFVAET